MAYRRAKALDTLTAQVNALAPGRSKKSDGWIGDAAHSSRASDHNPWVKDGSMGIVTAMDFTHHPGVFDAYQFAETLRARGDPRIKYVISNRRIYSGTGQGQPAWVWRKYNGSNPHDKHTHISVKSDKAHYDSTAPWDLGVPVTTQPVTIPTPEPKPRQTLKKGMTGGDVPVLQLRLKELGYYSGLVDGDFGPKTEAALKAFQTKAKLKADGIAGPLTWQTLGGSPPSNPIAPGHPEPIVRLSVPVHGLFSSDRAKAHIKSFESCVLTAHQVGGVWHIGWGRSNTSGKLPHISKGLTITQAEADAMFDDDLGDFEEAVKRLVKVLVTQGQFDALVSIAFNKGQTWLRDSELLKAANAGDWAGAAAAILKEVPPKDHKFYKGLLRRRKAEVALLQS
jgi:GH24 family phage-related lysozyme (muramidase)